MADPKIRNSHSGPNTAAPIIGSTRIEGTTARRDWIAGAAWGALLRRAA
jgi:hypothetical protein